LRFDNPARAISNAADSKLYTQCRATNEISVEAWVEPATVTQGGPATLVGLSTRPGNRNFMMGQRNNGTHGRWTGFARTSNTASSGQPEFDPNTWLGFPAPALMHVVYTRNTAGDEAFYVDGNLVESGIATKTGDFNAAWAWQNTASFTVGGEKDDPGTPWDTPTFWQGTVYLVSVYDRAITSAEVAQNYISGCGLPSTPVLAVELEDFHAQVVQQGVSVNWTTITETNSEKFEVERATSNGFFEKLSSVNAIGQSLQAHSYRFLDKFPQPGTNAYRLKMVDKDGSFSYSKVVEVYFDPGKSYVIFPNPAADKIFIQSLSIHGGLTTLDLYDLLGRKVWYETWDAKTNPMRELPVSRFPKGVYIYTIGNVQTSQSGKLTIE
jgi:hypothetical protein